MTRNQKVNKIFNRDGRVRIDYKDGSYAIIDSFFCRDVDEIVEEMMDWDMIDEKEKNYYLKNGRIVSCYLYEKDGYMYDGQGDILISDDVTDALYGAPYGLDYAARVIAA